MMGSLTSMFGSMFEQSKIMFAADKAYAIAAAGIDSAKYCSSFKSWFSTTFH